jgi:hypothetical protein
MRSGLRTFTKDIMPTTPQNLRQKAHEKSFDSLQRVHAMIFALAIGEAVKRILTIDDSTHKVNLLYEYLPQFIALIITVVPFYHGTHRHFDDRYVFNEKPVVWKQFVFFDYFACLLTACMFFWLALAIKEEVFFFIFTWMLGFNILWGFIVWGIHGAGTWKWATLNVLTVAIFLATLQPVPLPIHGLIIGAAPHLLPLVIVVGWFFFRLFCHTTNLRILFWLSVVTIVFILVVWLFYTNLDESWFGVFRQGVFLFVAALRTYFDYYLRWGFYFPESEEAEAETDIAVTPPASLPPS